MGNIRATAPETNKYNTKFYQPEKNTYSMDADGNWTAQYFYTVKIENFASEAPAYKSVIPSPITDIPAGLVCLGVSSQPTGDPGIVNMIVTYGPNQYSGGGETTPGNVFRSSQTSVQLANIDQAPLTDAEKKAKKADGVFEYLQGSVIYGYREVFETTGFDFSQANIIGSIGKTGNPAGMTGSTATQWLLIGRDIRETNGYIEVDQKWSWSVNDWPSDLYPP